MDRERLRQAVGRLPYLAVVGGLGSYAIDVWVLGHDRGGIGRLLPALGITFVVFLVVRFVLLRALGMTWRDALWPRREPPADR